MLEFRNTRFAARIIKSLTAMGADAVADYLEKIRDYDFFGRPKGTDYTGVTLEFAVDGYTVVNGALVRADSAMPVRAFSYLN